MPPYRQKSLIKEDNHRYQTLFDDHPEGMRVLLSPPSLLWMRIEKGRNVVVGTTIWVEDPVQSIIWRLVSEGCGLSEGLKENVPSNSEESLVMYRTSNIDETPQRLCVLSTTNPVQLAKRKLREIEFRVMCSLVMQRWHFNRLFFGVGPGWV